MRVEGVVELFHPYRRTSAGEVSLWLRSWSKQKTKQKMKRFFSKLTKDSEERATQCAVTHMGAVMAARPRIRDMVRDAKNARLGWWLPHRFWHDAMVDNAAAVFLDTRRQ